MNEMRYREDDHNENCNEYCNENRMNSDKFFFDIRKIVELYSHAKCEIELELRVSFYNGYDNLYRLDLDNLKNYFVEHETDNVQLEVADKVATNDCKKAKEDISYEEDIVCGFASEVEKAFEEKVEDGPVAKPRTGKSLIPENPLATDKRRFTKYAANLWTIYLQYQPMKNKKRRTEEEKKELEVVRSYLLENRYPEVEEWLEGYLKESGKNLNEVLQGLREGSKPRQDANELLKMRVQSIQGGKNDSSEQNVEDSGQKDKNKNEEGISNEDKGSNELETDEELEVVEIDDSY